MEKITGPSVNSQEQKNNNFEHAYDLAKAITEEFLKRYDLETGYRIEDKTGAKFDLGMDFWSYRIFGNNRNDQKPKSKEELISIFEEVINSTYKESLKYDNNAVEHLGEVYKYFILHDENVHPIYISGFKHKIERGLREKYDPIQGDPNPHYAGFNNEPQ